MTSKKLTLGMTTAFLVAMGGTYVVLNSTALNAWTAQVTSTDTLHNGGIVDPYTSPQVVPVTTPVTQPQPQVITKEVQVPGPERVVIKEVPGPERVVIKEVPGPERVVVKEVPGPERVVVKEVPGPERVVIKEVRVPVGMVPKTPLTPSGMSTWAALFATSCITGGLIARKKTRQRA